MKYLLLGNKGQLGKEFVKIFDRENTDYRGYDLDSLDISNFPNLRYVISEYRPDLIINCTAYNLVDLAEKNFIDAYRTNALAVRNLGVIATEFYIFLIHFSSDYVFDGNNCDLYREFDVPNPINEYGKSKLAGEVFLQEVNDKYLILRLSWVYGEGQQNFIYKLLQWSKNNTELKIVTDEISIPCSAKFIAEYTLKAFNAGLTGLFHLTNSGYASRYDWAKEILKNCEIEKKLIPVTLDFFNLPAKRPKFAAMSNRLISERLYIEIPDWQTALKEFMKVNRL
jgi:dTDP-4-dehydrorhamnose reductase